jgi:gamma-glutamyltranspeptidase/glutathione hydrolase
VAALVNQIVKKEMGDFTFDKSLKIFCIAHGKFKQKVNKPPIIRLWMRLEMLFQLQPSLNDNYGSKIYCDKVGFFLK